MLLIYFYYRFLQYGSYPVINPLNETFPPHFNTHRSHSHRIEVNTKDGGLGYTISKPLPGSWFTAVFIGKVKDDAIGIKVSI